MRKEKALRSVMAMLLALCLCLAALAGCEQKGGDAQDASDKKTEEKADSNEEYVLVSVQTTMPLFMDHEYKEMCIRDSLMPLKEDTELQILRSLSNTPLQVDVSFITVSSHESKNTPTSHLNKFYQKFSEVRDKKFDGFIITGAPVEQMPFEDVDYWQELKEIMEWLSLIHI